MVSWLPVNQYSEFIYWLRLKAGNCYIFSQQNVQDTQINRTTGASVVESYHERQSEKVHIPSCRFQLLRCFQINCEILSRRVSPGSTPGDITDPAFLPAFHGTLHKLSSCFTPLTATVALTVPKYLGQGFSHYLKGASCSCPVIMVPREQTLSTNNREVISAILDTFPDVCVFENDHIQGVSPPPIPCCLGRLQIYHNHVQDRIEWMNEWVAGANQSHLKPLTIPFCV